MARTHEGIQSFMCCGICGCYTPVNDQINHLLKWDVHTICCPRHFHYQKVQVVFDDMLNGTMAFFRMDDIIIFLHGHMSRLGG